MTRSALGGLIVGLLLAATGSARAQATAASPCTVLTPTLQGLYIGDCAAGLAHGRGRVAGTDRYEGQFRDGQPGGQGVYTFADGSRFEGEFSGGKVNGRARYVFTNGDQLEGQFRDNRLDGTGRLLRAGGEVLFVAWRDGAMVAVAPPAAPAAAVTPATPAVPATVADRSWAPRLDFEDLFPAYILATATRKPPPTQDRARSTSAGDDVSTRELMLQPRRAAARVASLADKATYLGDPWGLVGIGLRSTVPNSVVVVHIDADDAVDPTDETFQLGPAGDYALYPKLRYRYERLRTVAQPLPIRVNWSVTIDGRPAGAQTRTVRLRATQDAPFVVEGERGVEYMGWVFAAFVTEDAPWIDELLQQAFKGRTAGALGYQGSEEDVFQQVAAVYDALHRMGVKYSSITTNSGASDRVFSQTVRFPSDSIRNAQANCVDGTVLMASVLRKMNIDAYLVLGPGHAMLGFRSKPLKKGDDWQKDFYVVETTVIADANFVDSVKFGMAKYKKWTTENADDPRLAVISVSAARRAGVTPIAR